MAGVLRSLLAPALKKLADKGENIAINRLPDTLLKEQGLRKDEIDLIAPNFEEVDTTVSKSGNTLITPQGLRELEEKIPTFKTTEETQYDRDQLDFERVDAQTDSDLENERILGQLNELQRKREELITRGLEGGENLDPDELNKIELEAEMLQEEIQELDNIRGQSLVREDSVDLPQYKFDTFYKDITPSDVNDDTYGMLVVRDPRDDKSGYSAHLDYLGRDNYSYHMRYDTDPDELALRVFEMQRDIVGQEITPSSNQYSVFKKFPSGDKWDKDNFNDATPGLWWKWADEGRDLGAFREQDLVALNTQVDAVREKSYSTTFEPTKKETKEFEKEIENLNKLWNDLAKVPEEVNRKVPKLDYYQNLINRALVKADDEGLNKVKFFIGENTPESIEYMGLQSGLANLDNFKYSKDEELYSAWRKRATIPLGYLQRSFAIQNHYETVVANQIRKTAKKIGSSAIMDKKGYLVVALPAAGFTLPLYGEENKEASFIATAVSKGMDGNEAKEMVNDRVSEFPFPVNKQSNRENFNIGGRVLSSLKRKAS
jgi:hypothetical protein